MINIKYGIIEICGNWDFGFDLLWTPGMEFGGAPVTLREITKQPLMDF